jgi:CubicO group peptidase (beta-lactamase class C family)
MSTSKALPRSTPEAQGVPSSAVYAFVNAIEQNKLELHSLMLLRHGAVVAEGWWAPYQADYRHILHSLSKSFTSTAIGLAIAEGRLSVDDPVISFFPESLPDQVSENLAALRIKHLLSMSTGQTEDTTIARATSDRDWVRSFLHSEFPYVPGTHFLYNSGATYMLSAIIQKVTGMLLLDYLRPRLLDPLGITDVSWELSPQGVNTGGWGMSITTDAIARFGQLYLQKGVWNGEQLVPADWIAQATSYQIDNAGNLTNENLDWQQGYCYQFWRCRYNCYRGDGAFGQFCLAMPDQDAVLAITASLANMQAVLDLVWEHIRPAMSEGPLPAQPDAHIALAQKLSSLHIDPPAGKSSAAVAARVSGRQYVLTSNPLSFKKLRFDFSTAACDLTIGTATGEQHLICGSGEWTTGTLSLLPFGSRTAASGVWLTEDTFVITLRYVESSAFFTLRCQFLDSNSLTVDIHTDGALNGQDYQLVGAATATI